MKKHFLMGLLSIVFLISGCAGIEAGGEVQSGRYALRSGNPDSALVHLRRAAELDPNYNVNINPFRPSVWTYLGWSSYNARKFPEARRALEMALARDKQDELATLYLGLTLARDGDERQARQEIERALKGIRDRIDQAGTSSNYGSYWDPNMEIRYAIRTNLELISTGKIDLTALESVGRKIDEEAGLASRDEAYAHRRGGDGGD